MASISTHIDGFLDYLEYQKRYSKHTIAAYRNDLRAFSDFMDLIYEESDPGAVRSRQISSFVASLAEGGASPASLNRKLSSIQSFYRFLLSQDLVSTNPATDIQRPKTSSHLPTFVRKENISALFTDLSFEDSFPGYRDRLLLGILYSCGLRRSELLAMKDVDVDAQQLQLKVLGKRNKERIIPISSQLIGLIEDYKRYRSEAGFQGPYLLLTNKGEKMYPGLVYTIVKKYLSQVTTLEKKSPHVLRHTFATHLLNEGANLQSIKELLGHASLASTQVYTHTTLEQLKDVYKSAHPRSKP